jgi:hypothetical protein
MEDAMRREKGAAIQRFFRVMELGGVTNAVTDAAIKEAFGQALAAGKFACAKCGRVFKTASEFRYDARHEMICRRFCRGAR